jgi:hypothetical protein
MINKKQLISYIKKELSKFDAVTIGQQKCLNEAQTRTYLIEPFLEILGYSRLKDLVTEFAADFGDRNINRVDYAITLNSKQPIIVIECKKYGKKLTDKDAGQLNNYFVNTSTASVGILTNGIEYKFYASEKKDSILNKSPFYVFDLEKYDDSDFEMLSKFHRSAIEIKDIIEEANEAHFLSKFDEALFKELLSPSDDFVKAISSRMGVSRLRDTTKTKVKELVNSFSIKSALDKIIIEESKKGGNTGIVTTDDEKKYYHVIKTVLLQSKKISSERIGYRDQKNSFAILIDDNIRKCICSLVINDKKKKLIIGAKEVELTKIEDVLSLKKELTESAIKHLEI